MIFNENIECLSPENLKNLQSERLVKLVQYIYEYNPIYRKKIEALGLSPKDIKDINDIKRLPFTTKEDMRDSYPYGLFCRPQKDLQEIHVSSGTTGNPTLVGYTKNDLDLWGEVMARSFACAGAVPGNIIQIAYGYGLFTGGLGSHYGALKLGLTIIPASSGQTKRQLKLMQDFKPRILACTPSYCLYMVEEAIAMGLDPRQSSWEIGVYGAEPWSESMRTEIEKVWNILATDVYGLSEIIGPDTGKEVAPGEKGELVITTLTKEGIPLLRYRTRDIVSITYETCACGRTSPRISKISGRTDDMIIVRGINVFPSQIEHVLLQIEGVKPHYQIIVDRKAGKLDELEVLVEVEEKLFSDEIKKLVELERKITKELESILSVSAKVRLVEPKTIERSEGKAKRIIDKRKL